MLITAGVSVLLIWVSLGGSQSTTAPASTSAGGNGVTVPCRRMVLLGSLHRLPAAWRSSGVVVAVAVVDVEDRFRLGDGFRVRKVNKPECFSAIGGRGRRAWRVGSSGSR